MVAVIYAVVVAIVLMATGTKLPLPLDHRLERVHDHRPALPHLLRRLRAGGEHRLPRGAQPLLEVAQGPDGVRPGSRAAATASERLPGHRGAAEQHQIKTFQFAS